MLWSERFVENYSFYCQNHWVENGDPNAVSPICDEFAFWVALAGRRREVVQSSDLPGVQLEAVGGDVLLDTRTRLVPGIGAMSSPCASSQASATCAGVAPASAATALTSSTIRRLPRPPQMTPSFLMAAVPTEFMP